MKYGALMFNIDLVESLKQEPTCSCHITNFYAEEMQNRHRRMIKNLLLKKI